MRSSQTAATLTDMRRDGSGGTKWCAHCKTYLPPNSFSPNRARPDLLAPYCRPCASAKTMQRYWAMSDEERRLLNRRHWQQMKGTARRAESKRLWDEAHRRENSARTVAWQKANPERVNLKHRIRRQKKRSAAPSDVTGAAWLLRAAEFGNRCAYCASLMRVPEMDHIVPIASGGTHTMDNLVPACRRCNSSKSGRPMLVWLLGRRRALNA